MKRLVSLAAVVVCAGAICSAEPACVSGTLSSYLALGSSGCLIGSNTLFDFVTVGGTTGATAILPSGISLSPFGGTLDPGLNTTINVTANAGSILEALFTYKISGNSYVGSSITLASSSESGDGAVTGVENFCAGGVFGPDGVTGCSGLPGTLVTLDSVQNQDAAAFGPASLLSVTNDFIVDSGLAGSASAGTLTDRFTAVPEPVNLLLAALGLAVAIGLRFIPKSGMFVRREREVQSWRKLSTE